MQQQTTEAEVEAARVRVTPSELAQATAIVEARRDAEAKHLADTIALGEAVQQLGLAATPEELFAEVQALRAGAQQNNTKVEATSGVIDHESTKKQLALLVGFMACSFILAFGFIMPQMSNAGRTDYAQSLAAMQMVSPAIAQPTSVYSAPAPTTSTTASTDAEQVRKLNPGLFQSLDLKEGQSAHCGIEEIQSLARGANPAQIWVAKKASEYFWQLTRKAGRLRVQCWTTSVGAAHAANGQPAIVDAFENSDAPLRIALPIDKFANPSTTGENDGVVTAVQVN